MADPKDDELTLEETVAAAMDGAPDDEPDDDVEAVVEAAAESEVDDEPADEPEDGEEDDGEDEPAPDDEEDKADDLVAAPEHWPQAERDGFAKLDKGAQKFVLEQDKGFKRRYDQKVAGLHDDQRLAETVNKAFEPFKRDMQLNGMSAAQAVTQLVAAHGLLTTEPDKGFEHLAAQQGYKPRDPAKTLKAIANRWGVEVAADESEPKHIDPLAKQEIDTLKAEVSTLRNAQTEFQNQAVQSTNTAAQADVVAFMEAKDEAGKLTHPHMEKLAPTMGKLIQSGVAKDMADAYEQASLADPDLRAEWLESRIKAKSQTNGKAERQKKAKRAGRNVQGVKVAGKVADDNLSVEDEVRRAAGA